MTIEYQATIDALDSAISTTDAHDVKFAGGGSTTRAVSLDPELADAKAVLATLRSAASAYHAAEASWATSYASAFRILDRRARYVLSLTTTAPAALTFSTDDDTHTAIVARADSAAGSSAPSTALTDLAVYRGTFDTSWSAKPSDGGAAGVALEAALARAQATIDFLAWARSDA